MGRRKVLGLLDVTLFTVSEPPGPTPLPVTPGGEAGS
jgi:hypothetical protein